MNMEITRPVVMEVSLSNFEHNISQIRDRVGEEVTIMPVIKGNAYGTYLNKKLEILNKFDIVAVATVDEGVDIRRLGYAREIFVLNQPFETEIDKIVQYGITVGISSYAFAEQLGRIKSPVRVHVEIGTGMGRTGIHPYRVDQYIQSLPENIIVEGVYTHLSSADNDDEFTRSQLKSFNVAVNTMQEMLGELKYVHCSASNGIVNYPDSYFNLVRAGLIMYGYASAEDTLKKIDIKPVTTLKGRISFLKEVVAGTSVGYGRSFITERESKIATVPMGYADGFRRVYSNGWEVLIRGQKAPIVGKVCMDSFMVDVTDIEGVQAGDEVIIWDNENITVEMLAEKCDTINYEILCSIGDRVPRKYVY